MAAASARVVARRSEPASASSETSTARSAPSASARRSASAARSGPIETTTTSPPPAASRWRSPSSIACTSNGLSASSPERSRRLVCGSMRRGAAASGTSFTQIAIFISAGTLPGRADLHTHHSARPVLPSEPCCRPARQLAARSSRSFSCSPRPASPRRAAGQRRAAAALPGRRAGDLHRRLRRAARHRLHEGNDLSPPSASSPSPSRAAPSASGRPPRAPAACSTCTATPGRPTSTST